MLALAIAGLLTVSLLEAGAASAASPSVVAGTTSASSSATAVHGRVAPKKATCNWRARKCFGAISVNIKSYKAYFSNDKKSKSTAVNKAQNKCFAKTSKNRQCRKAGWVRNGCLAVAYRLKSGTLKEWSSAYAYGKAKAKAKAKKKVAGPGKVGIWAWLCTTRRA
ncbi:MAG: DUF4189 domain-containing protein [Nocardioides sp.]|uniref:DUF4189 domain-containing protein n=1 Tax=Nocardioides sp. TaxID=35761 RepID=UPI0039E613EA